HFPVVYAYPYVADIGTGERPFLHFFHHAFEDRRQETRIDSAAYDAVVEHEFAAPAEDDLFGIADREFLAGRHAFEPGFNLHENFPELARATGLLLMPVIGLRGFLDGFAVGN